MRARWIATILLLMAFDASAEVTVAELQATEFVFVGLVTKTESVVFPEVSTKLRLAEVHVEEIMAKPEPAVLRPRDKVFVAFKEPFPEVNMRLKIFGAALSYGTAIAMQEVSRAEAPPLAMAAEDVTKERDRVRDSLKDAQIDRDLEAAAAAVVGKVVAIAKVPWDEQLTEHDPAWTDAVVEVKSWIKGGSDEKIVVQFPASYDHDWYDVPKLKVGAEWTFLLHEGARPTTLDSEAANLKRFRIISKGDVLSVSEAETVKRLNDGGAP